MSDEDDRLIDLPRVKEIVGLGKTMVYRLVREGRFPKPCKPGGAATRWSETEVRAWKACVLADRSD
ncbi:helix-turn-helix transcriptional regulator [Sphingomonas abietis]|uniref:AlpA family phage regulatory protein n=1 Tax=Sphingomonas abietis TaxID=3012344 RepID=A0ABY7NQS2_9SPHN|nr:AlpA family phage regulatory protein [Sphingomonas abietis]WBO22289.1 AlpA family phage regulatory protein [Sphingomonas abietis]